MTEHKFTQEEFDKLLTWMALQEELNTLVNTRLQRLESK